MIPRVRPRSANVGDVLRYLFGPGDDGEHHDQRLVGAWEAATVRGMSDLQPQSSNGVRSVARLAGLLEQPVLAGNNPPLKPVWHCSLHNHAEDPVLTDAQWGQVAADFLDGVGLAPLGDLAAVRWVDLDARHAWRTRIDTLIPPGTEQTTFSTSRLFAATYPEAVKIAALVGSLHWRRQAAGDPDGQRRFAAEIGRRLGQPDYQPKVTQDSIAHWINDDCWRLPTLPPTTYRTLPGFGNPTITKPNKHSLDRHHRSARWFARNRRGGRVILYHRHVGPVLTRDWSHKMEQFVATVEASAETRTRREIDGKDACVPSTAPELVADYIRPTAVKSEYLDRAAEPVP